MIMVHLHLLEQENVDNKGVIEYVKSKGYDGDWLVECDAWPNDPVADCKQSYEYLKGLLF